MKRTSRNRESSRQQRKNGEDGEREEKAEEKPRLHGVEECCESPSETMTNEEIKEERANS